MLTMEMMQDWYQDQEAAWRCPEHTDVIVCKHVIENVNGITHILHDGEGRVDYALCPECWPLFDPLLFDKESAARLFATGDTVSMYRPVAHRLGVPPYIH